MTPAALADTRVRRCDGVTVDVMDRAAIEAAGMGAFAAVARGSHEEPRLITIRYEPADVAGPLLGFVGKAVTFDTGGISIKPAGEDARDEVRHVAAAPRSWRPWARSPRWSFPCGWRA